jgi:hypothetical protein
MIVKIRENRAFNMYKNLEVAFKDGDLLVDGDRKGRIANIKYGLERGALERLFARAGQNLFEIFIIRRSFFSVFSVYSYYVKFDNLASYEKFSDFIDENLDICSICLMPLFIERKTCYLCGNSFHKNCADAWMKRKKTCALCKGGN